MYVMKGHKMCIHVVLPRYRILHSVYCTYSKKNPVVYLSTKGIQGLTFDTQCLNWSNESDITIELRVCFSVSKVSNDC